MTKLRADSRQCRICHCTDAVGCVAEDGSGGTCTWIEADLCSACAGIEIGLEIVEERLRQQSEEGHSIEADDAHAKGELAMAAAAYAAFATYTDHRRAGHRTMNWKSPLWPAGWKWNPKDRRHDLIRAGALIIAELERLDRQERAETELAGMTEGAAARAS